MTSIMMPILDFAILILSIMTLLGLPIGLLLRRRTLLDCRTPVVLASLIIGTAVVVIEYMRLIEWCHSIEQMPYLVSCSNFLPFIHGSALFGLLLAILMAYLVGRRQSGGIS